MICISINQESRRLALVDMLNASAQCDLLEIRLDRFGMAPEIADLLSHKPAPVIMTCRRQQDGGHWDGTEAERLALLRQCIISKADYVEIELDAADEVRRMPPTKRVISYTVKETDKAADIMGRYAEAQKKSPDVIKLTTDVETPEQAWPFVQILVKPPVPTVVMGKGVPSAMLAILGRKIGAPWTYAALEKGMEAYPHQPTVHELREIYHYGQIDRKTRLIGVTGFEGESRATVTALNAALKHLELPARCLPLSVGDAALFAKVINAVKLAGVIIDPEHQHMLAEVAAQKHASADFAKLVDVILAKQDAWQGYYVSAQSARAALEQLLRAKSQSENPLQGRMTIIVGINAMARSLAAELIHRKVGVILASRQKKAVQEMAKELNCRHIQFEAIGSTMHDTMIICDEEIDPSAPGRADGIHASLLKEGAAFMDLTSPWNGSPLLHEATQRGCLVAGPRDVLLSRLQLQTKMLTGKPIERNVLAAALAEE